MQRSVIIVAGGKGKRMNASIPKQFVELNGKPILMHTIECFARFDEHILIVVALPIEHISFWEKLCQTHHFLIPHTIVAGGNTRFQSVKNGLAAIQKSELIAVHDGVRPLTSDYLVRHCFEEAYYHETAVPMCRVTESVRMITSHGSQYVDRDSLRLIQTPQVFQSFILRAAYGQMYEHSFTDDASVVERMGIQLNLIDGEQTNIKITTPFDLKMAEMILNSGQDVK